MVATLAEVGHYVTGVHDILDQCVIWTLAPLGLWILLNGLDDLFIDVLWVSAWLGSVLRRRPLVPLPQASELAAETEKRIAIFLPLWHEHEVVGNMLAHNIAAIRYRRYDFFVGAYPNDEPTLQVVRAAERRFPNVHLALCPHDGPTSKPDCLNWIYQRMLLDEESSGDPFDIVVTHDAEDLIHPESLRWINHYSDTYDFVQIPVLALSTPLSNLTHGVYCDEFAQFQMRDLPVRNRMRGFLPSAGVGTAYSRKSLEALAIVHSNCIFDPTSLTEDYENGFRLHELGFRQLFVPITGASAVATREYFPCDIRAAIRQRTRWVTGISLQGWERHGWCGGFRQIYWLWRDRKGLLATPVSLLANGMFLYGWVDRIWTRAVLSPHLIWVLSATLALGILREAVRIGCSARLYGPVFGLLAPLRALVSNLINGVAVLRALYYYARARARHENLAWVKTAHAYPTREALVAERRTLEEILVGSAYVDQQELDEALAVKPTGAALGEYLVAMGLLTEDELYDALSLAQQLPLVNIQTGEVGRRLLRALPAQVTAEWHVLPFRVSGGMLDVACQKPPVPAMEAALRAHTALQLRFHLITPMQYRELAELLNSSDSPTNCRAAAAGATGD